MRMKIGMIVLCMVLVSCEDSSESEEVVESVSTPVIPISLESGTWLIHGVEIVENTCSSEEQDEGDATLPFLIAETEGVVTMTIEETTSTCERTDNEISCSFELSVEGEGVNKGHYGPTGGGDLWEPELEWTCDKCNGVELWDANTVNGVPVKAPQGVCFDTDEKRTNVTLEEECNMQKWVSFSENPGDPEVQVPTLVQTTYSFMVNSSSSMSLNMSGNTACKEGESATCAEAIAANLVGYATLPCTTKATGVGTYCGPDENNVSAECMALGWEPAGGYSVGGDSVGAYCGELQQEMNAADVACEGGEQEACEELEKILQNWQADCAGDHDHGDGPGDDEEEHELECEAHYHEDSEDWDHEFEDHVHECDDDNDGEAGDHEGEEGDHEEEDSGEEDSGEEDSGEDA